MKVTNNTSFALIAFGWLQPKGYGDDVEIPPGETAEVNGPYLGEMGGGSCHVALAGEVVCKETPDDANGLQVAKGNPIHLGGGNRGITIRHHVDTPDECVTAWRRSNQHKAPLRAQRNDLAGERR